MRSLLAATVMLLSLTGHTNSKPENISADIYPDIYVNFVEQQEPPGDSIRIRFLEEGQVVEAHDCPSEGECELFYQSDIDLKKLKDILSETRIDIITDASITVFVVAVSAAKTASKLAKKSPRAFMPLVYGATSLSVYHFFMTAFSDNLFENQQKVKTIEAVIYKNDLQMEAETFMSQINDILLEASPE